MKLDDVLRHRLLERERQHLLRYRQQMCGPQSPEVINQQQAMINFCSNDYLGLANHPAVIRSFQQASRNHGVGSGASHLVCGHHELHNQLEEALAAFTGYEKVLLFSSGYMANLGVINALTTKGDYILQDKLNHASLIDGGLISQAQFRRYTHADIGQLEKRLQNCSLEQHKLVVTDGVFSMDGDIAPLPELVDSVTKHDAWLMVDDAHGFGVLGATGKGIIQHFGLSPEQVPILVGTLGKAFGTYGAFVAGSKMLIEALIQFARTYIYTTALPAALAAASLTSLRLIQEESWRRSHLQQLITFFRHEVSLQGWQLLPSCTPIQPVLVGDADRCVQISHQLQKRGFWVTAIRSPTVPQGTARLRITFSAEHTMEQVEQLIDALANIKGLQEPL
ncbi:8-amino-7-oxononanoate synthase [Zooshikella ganghwensis]|uniref:8-amino-7-oxononanoate synthase n=1 Tax=Zooshikella ganghwensis TaxID=202772 RepID=UPI0004113411|nr:8-amino-7-oxononanoate synthase [Zooshikella ganghwensis]